METRDKLAARKGAKVVPASPSPAMASPAPSPLINSFVPASPTTNNNNNLIDLTTMAMDTAVDEEGVGAKRSRVKKEPVASPTAPVPSPASQFRQMPTDELENLIVGGSLDESSLQYRILLKEYNSREDAAVASE